MGLFGFIGGAKASVNARRSVTSMAVGSRGSKFGKSISRGVRRLRRRVRRSR